ncbi:MAG: hypothetical protein ACP5N2_06775 [Candidatus Nanoarchaeia archaeon]
MQCKNKKNKKGIIKSSLVSLITMTALFLIIILVFFGDGLLNQAFEKLREKISDVPEIDPNKAELDFFRNQDNQLLYLKNFHASMQVAATSEPINKACLLELPSLEQDGFYEDGYNMYIDQSDEDTITLRLTKLSKQDYEDPDQATQSPVASMAIEGVKLCIIGSGSPSLNFYNEFNDIKSGDVPNVEKITPTKVHSLLISSAKKEGGEQREIGYKIDGNAKYEWNAFFKKGTKTQPYVFKKEWLGTTYLCFFPAEADIGGGCGAPGGLEFMDTDCFDSDAEGSKSLPYNFKKGLLTADYKCAE